MKKIDLGEGLLERVPKPALIAVPVVVVAVVAWLLLGGSGGDGGGGGDHEAWKSAYEPRARKTAKAVVERLKPYGAALDTVAADPRVSAALGAGDNAALAALAETLTPTLDGVLRLRLLPANVRDPQPQASPPLSFASISMLRRARENASAPDAEVHLAGSDNEHLVMIRRVELAASEEMPTLLGFAHLSIDPGVVAAVLSDNPPGGVYAEIKQGVKVQLAASGTPPAAGAPATVARIPGTVLSVKYTAPGELPAAASGGNVLNWLAPLFLIGIIGGLLFYRSQRQSVRVSGVNTDTVIYQGAIKAILDGAHPGLEALMPGARTTPTDFDLAATMENRAAGEDVTTFTPAATVDDPTEPRDDDNIAAADPAGVVVSEADPVPASIFRSYDIRGIVDETLTEDGVYQIGRALGAEAEARNQKTVVVARDGRHSSETLLEALTKGLLESGRDVLDIGLAPTPVLYFATHYLDARSGVMITGNHNPAQYNGLKIVLDGETLSGEAIQAIRRRVDEQDFFEGTGSIEQTDIVAEYIRRISEDIPVTLGNALRVVVDCGNGVPGTVAPDILRAIGHDVIELYCDVDGDFPNHHPDPSQPENLETLIQTVQDEGADIGLAFDGDGDRLGVVDGEGNVIWPDRQMILFARDILSRNPGAKIIYDVKCSRLLGAEIAASGGEPTMFKTGHSLIKSKMQETGALLAGEMSGHIFFKERWYGFDDALYSAARLLEILINSGQTPAEVFAALPGGVVTPELRLDMPEEEHAGFMEKVLAAATFDNAEISTIDGLRVDFPDSWGLIRPSNTTPCLVMRFEGDDEAALEGVKEQFRGLLSGIDPALELPF